MADKGSIKRLEFCNFKLDTLLEFTQAINANVGTEELMLRYEMLLTRELKIGKVLLLAYNQADWRIVLHTGLDLETALKINAEKHLSAIDEITTTPTVHHKVLHLFDIVIPVFHLDAAMAYLLIGDIDEEREGVSPVIKHLHFIQTLTNIIIVAIENKRLFTESLRQESIKKELKLASELQSMLIPSSSIYPQNEKFFIHSYYLPHYEVGGDYYDLIKFSPDQIGFCIADVSGKGISAAFIMSNFQASLRALFSPEIEIGDLVKRLNQVVAINSAGQRFITLFIAKFDASTHILEYVNAGHNPPMLYDMNNKKLTYLTEGCVGIGMLDEITNIEVGKIKLSSGHPGSKILCYTDGLVELNSDQTIESSLETITQIFGQEERIDASIQRILLDYDIQKGNTNFFDDISIFGVEIY